MLIRLSGKLIAKYKNVIYLHLAFAGGCKVAPAAIYYSHTHSCLTQCVCPAFLNVHARIQHEQLILQRHDSDLNVYYYDLCSPFTAKCTTQNLFNKTYILLKYRKLDIDGHQS